MADLNALLEAKLAELDNAPKWDDAQFGKIKRLSNTKVGDAGQNFVEAICGEFGFGVAFPLAGGKRKKQNPWDIEIQNIKFELKTASEDTKGAFQFNHVRYHRPYDALLCLGVSPHSIWFGIWTKASVTTDGAGKLVSMEKGANASYKLTKRKADLLPIDQFQSVVGAFVNDFQP